VIVFGVDVGGSGVKGAPVDVDRGELVTKRTRIRTPRPSTPAAVAEVIAQIADRFGWDGPVGVALPSVVRGGVVETAANIDPSWIGTDAVELLSVRLGGPVTALNDADAAGLAEVAFGSARGVSGVAICLTFGTGIGSAVFVDGRLVPNTELGHLEFHGGEAEAYAAGRLVEEDEMALEWWAARVGEYLRHLERLFWPEVFVLGGGISKRFDEFAGALQTRTPVVAARLRNKAGIVGAAYATTLGGG